jgi:hypothetical protein
MRYLKQQLNAALTIAAEVQRKHPLASQFQEAKDELIRRVGDKLEMALLKSCTLDLPPGEATKMLLTSALRNRRNRGEE